jgi:hypothetical protein
MKHLLQIDRIRLDGQTHHRTGLNQLVINEFAFRMLAGDLFPPLKVYCDGDHYWLTDGFLRIEAARRIGFSTLEAVITFGNCHEAVFFSIGKDSQDPQGLPLNSGDTRHCIRLHLSDPDWAQMNDQEIATRCAVSPNLVLILRQTMTDFG